MYCVFLLANICIRPTFDIANKIHISATFCAKRFCLVYTGLRTQTYLPAYFNEFSFAANRSIFGIYFLCSVLNDLGQTLLCAFIFSRYYYSVDGCITR